MHPASAMVSSALTYHLRSVQPVALYTATPSPFDAVIFDLDGTLIDSFEQIVTSLSLAFAVVGVKPAVPVEALADGSPLEDIFAVADRGAHPDVFPAFVQAYRQAYQSVMKDSRLFPGVRETLQTLTMLVPVPRLAIASSKREEIIREILKTLAIEQFFSVVIGSGHGTARHKPAPDILVRAATELSVAPNRCLMVGDTLRDLGAARSAGMAIAVVTYGGMGAIEPLIAAQPDYVLEDFEQLLLLVSAGASD